MTESAWNKATRTGQILPANKSELSQPLLSRADCSVDENELVMALNIADSLLLAFLLHRSSSFKKFPRPSVAVERALKTSIALQRMKTPSTLALSRFDIRWYVARFALCLIFPSHIGWTSKPETARATKKPTTLSIISNSFLPLPIFYPNQLISTSTIGDNWCDFEISIKFWSEKSFPLKRISSWPLIPIFLRNLSYLEFNRWNLNRSRVICYDVPRYNELASEEALRACW